MRNVYEKKKKKKKKKKKNHGKGWASLPIDEMLRGGIPDFQGYKIKKKLKKKIYTKD
jgi:hypothetical protein